MEKKRFYSIWAIPFIFVLFISLGLTSCVKDDIVDNIDNPEENDSTVRSDNNQTIFMYMPWSTNLLSNFQQNINDLETALGSKTSVNFKHIAYKCLAV